MLKALEGVFLKAFADHSDDLAPEISMAGLRRGARKPKRKQVANGAADPASFLSRRRESRASTRDRFPNFGRISLSEMKKRLIVLSR